MKKILVGLLKVVLSVAIVVWLLWDAFNKDPEAVNNLRTGAKDWWLLAGAALASSGTVIILIVRWYYLVRALGIDCRLRDICRISLVGYLFNLAPMGVVGGDLLKAWMLAREQHGHRAESLASIVVDRVIGLYMLFVVASVAILGTGFLAVPSAGIHFVAQATLGLTVVGTLGMVALLGPEAIVGRFVRLVGRIPYAGRPLERLTVAVRLYRHKLPVLLAAALLSVAIHGSFILCIQLIALGLPGTALSIREHAVVAPLSAVTGVIPMPAGPQEGAMRLFYEALASAPLKGLAISLTYRIITVLIAAVGMGYYLASRREVAEVLHEVQDAAPQTQIPISQPAV